MTTRSFLEATEADTYKNTVSQIQRHAEKDFSRHALNELGPNEWHCGRPDNNAQSFSVILRRHAILIYGDVGDGVFAPNTTDPLGWLQGAIRSPSYLLGKLRTFQRSNRTERLCFYPGDALAALRDNYEQDPTDESKERLQEALELIEKWDDFNARTWEELLRHTDMDMYGSAMNYSAADLWLVEALRWFVNNLPVKSDDTS